MLPIRSIVLALCASVAIAAPLSGSVCPSEGDCPTCYGRETPDLGSIVCDSESAFIVATGVDPDGMNWQSPRRWQDIFGAQGSRYAIEHFPIDERHWDNEADKTCRTYYAKPAYEITKGQAPRRVQTSEVAAFKINQRCSCMGLIAEAGYAVVAFKNQSIKHADELANLALDQGVVVVPLPRGEFRIPSCDAKFAEDKSDATITTEKLPAVFANDDSEAECDKVTSCPKCELLQNPEQLKNICQSAKELMIVKQSLSRENLESQKAPWHMPKLEVHVDKDSSKEGAYEIRTKITPRLEKGCVKPTFRVLTGMTDSVDGVFMLKNMQLGEQCQCDFIRRDHGFAMIRSERDLHKSDVLSDKETIIVLPRGHYVLNQCPKEDENQRSDSDEEEKAQCDQPEETCPVCDGFTAEQELRKGLENGDAYVVKMHTNGHLKKSEDSDETRCGSADIISVLKGEKENVKSEISFTLPKKCECGAMSGYGRQFYAVVKKDAMEGERLEKLPLNEKVFIIGHNYRVHNLVQRWLNPEGVDEAEDRSGYDGYASYAPPAYAYAPPAPPAYAPPAYAAPAYAPPAYAPPAYPAPAYAAPAYPAPAYAAPAYPAPAYAAPAYPAPAYAAPAYPAPAYAAPAYPAPAYAAPAYPAPAYAAPAYPAPAYPAPAYAAPAYPAPAYAAPAYPAPAYAAPAPAYAPLYSSSYSYMTAPSYGIDYAPPAYAPPAYAAPAYPAPAYAAPAYPAPAYAAPAYAAPAYAAPAYPAPAYAAPAYPAPAYAAPAYPAPAYAAPAYAAPAYAAPAYGYSPAPSYGYSAPAYGYSPAPAYDAPAYPAPAYAAPAYPAPAYAAPAYPAPAYAAPAYPAPAYAAPAYPAPAYAAPAYPAPAYPAPAYDAPAYPAPAYAAPAYPAPAPAYPAPAYAAPAYAAPAYPAPAYDAPAYPAPAYAAPAYPAPAYAAPAYPAPAYAAPAYPAPAYPAPAYDAPAYPAPAYAAPAYPAPAYAAPAYAAPAYAAPAYAAPAYPAPAYAAPAYPAPAYAAPAYPAPAYAAPAYPAPAYAAPAYPAPAYAAPAYPAPAYAAPAYPAPAYDAPAYGAY